MAPSKIQLVGRYGDRSNVFDDLGMNELIASCDAPKDPYTVVAIIGPQSTGKSTLMNAIFGTDFRVLDERYGRGRTTEGIWASICNNPRAVVLDVEGSDSEDNQNDLGFERRSGLFALVISDVIFFNIWLHDVKRNNSNALLTDIFEELVRQAGSPGLPQQHDKHLVFAVRDYNGKTRKSILEEQITSSVNKIWKSIPYQKENSKLERYFKLHVELFPDPDHKEAEFNNKCKEIKGRSYWVDRGLSHLPVCDFASSGKQIWDKIVRNKSLDIPSHRETMSRASCKNIMSEKLQKFKSEYDKHTSPGNDDPKEFDNQLRKILNNILSEYDNETQVYGEYAKESRQSLNTKSKDHAKGGFSRVMELFQRRILENTQHETELVDIEERVNSVVTKYHDEFLGKTEDLMFYNKQDQINFLERLQLMGSIRIADIKKTREQKALHVAKVVLAGVGAAATGVTGIVGLAPVGAAIGATAAVATIAASGTVAVASNAAVAAIKEAEGTNHKESTVAVALQKLRNTETDVNKPSTSSK